MTLPPRTAGDPLTRLGLICAEAVRAHGEDVAKVGAHVARALQSLAADERVALEQGIERVLILQSEAAGMPRRPH